MIVDLFIILSHDLNLSYMLIHFYPYDITELYFMSFLRLPLLGGFFWFLYGFVRSRWRRRVWPYPYLVTLISAKLHLRFTVCSTYWILALIPKLHQFYKKFLKYPGHGYHCLPFFFKIGPCHPDKLKAAYLIY